MAIYPHPPVPADASVAAVIDPALRFESDAGFVVRRARTRRGRRLFQLTYLGLTSSEMRLVRTFLIDHRLSVTPFQYIHWNATDVAVIANTTPVTLTYQHGCQTGQWIIIGGSPGGVLDQTWQVTKITHETLTLNGSSAIGTGTCATLVYLPSAVGYFPDETFPPPEKLIGPDSVSSPKGRFSMVVTIEELL